MGSVVMKFLQNHSYLKAGIMLSFVITSLHILSGCEKPAETPKIVHVKNHALICNRPGQIMHVIAELEKKTPMDKIDMTTCKINLEEAFPVTIDERVTVMGNEMVHWEKTDKSESAWTLASNILWTMGETHADAKNSRQDTAEKMGSE
jgi:hypothetical protein